MKGKKIRAELHFAASLHTADVRWCDAHAAAHDVCGAAGITMLRWLPLFTQNSRAAGHCTLQHAHYTRWRPPYIRCPVQAAELPQLVVPNASSANQTVQIVDAEKATPLSCCLRTLLSRPRFRKTNLMWSQRYIQRITLDYIVPLQIEVEGNTTWPLTG